MGKDKDYDAYCHFVFVCNGKDCCKSGAKDLQKEFSKELKERGLKDAAKVIKTKCTGRCKQAPVAIVGQRWLGNVKESQVPLIIEELLLQKAD